MKKTLNNKTYNTATAAEVACDAMSNWVLYRKSNGEYFVVVRDDDDNDYLKVFGTSRDNSKSPADYMWCSLEYWAAMEMTDDDFQRLFGDNEVAVKFRQEFDA